MCPPAPTARRWHDSRRRRAPPRAARRTLEVLAVELHDEAALVEADDRAGRDVAREEQVLRALHRVGERRLGRLGRLLLLLGRRRRPREGRVWPAAAAAGAVYCMCCGGITQCLGIAGWRLQR